MVLLNYHNDTKEKKPGFHFLLKKIVFFLVLHMICVYEASQQTPQQQQQQLRFGENGEFKILQVADMHYADGKSTPCKDVLPYQYFSCSDLNTSDFLNRIIVAEKPDLIVFTGMSS